MNDRRQATRLSLLLFILGAIAALWSVVVAWTGGFFVRFGGIRLSSRSPWPALTVAVASGLAAYALSTREERARAWRSALAWLEASLRGAAPGSAYVAPAIAALTAVGITAAAIWRGSPYVAGSDIYGYVSQAHMWAAGNLHMDQPLLREMSWPYAREAVSPLGYRPAVSGTSSVPVYSPGLPLLMALFELMTGPGAVYYVVPLFAGAAVWATFVMGARVVSPAAGASAAVLVATSPPFVAQSLIAMSDVPVAAWWTIVWASLTFDNRRASLGAGLAAGMAILTRPNHAPLALVPGAYLLWRAARAPRERPVQRLLLFAAGTAAGCVAVAVINARLYGSALRSGYGPLSDLYAWSNFLPNLERYPAWMVQIHTPIVLLALLSPFIVRRWPGGATVIERRTVSSFWLAFVAALFLSYLFYIPFDEWSYLRFVLAALPPLFVLSMAALAALLGPLVRVPSTVTLIVALLVGGERLAFSIRGGTFDIAWLDRKYAAVGEYIDRRLPARAVLISMQHSGTARYYSGRLTIRWDWTERSRFDWLVDELRRTGYHPYFLLEEFELDQFRSRFRHSPLGALDWPATAFDRPGRVWIYDPADRDAARQGRYVHTDTIR